MEIQSELFAFRLYPIKDSCKLDSQKSTWVDVKSDYFCLMFAYFFLKRPNFIGSGQTGDRE